MAYLDRWKTIFPEVVGSEARPEEPIDNSLAFNTDGFPQFIANDPVGFALQNAFLMQLFSNDARLGERIDSLDDELDEHKEDTNAHANGISGNAASATKIKTARTIDGVSFDGSAAIIHYGTCSTAAGTVAKTVDCANFNLVTGAIVFVKFTVTNTAANPTLNVNSTGAKVIQYRGSAISAGYLAANRTYAFVYDGTNYQLIGDLDTNTTYSNFVKSGSDAKAGLVPAPPTTAGTTKYLCEDGTWQVPPDNNTDTHWTTHLYAGSGTAANAATTNGNTKLTAVDNSTVRNSVTIKGTGATTVTSDAKGVITINSSNTTYSAGTTAQLNTGTDTENRVWSAKQIANYVKGKANLAQNGYWKAPNGLIIQWGTVSANATKTFPIAFPSSVMAVLMTGVGDYGWVSDVTKTSFKVRNDHSSYFVAIGQ